MHLLLSDQTRVEPRLFVVMVDCITITKEPSRYDTNSKFLQVQPVLHYRRALTILGAQSDHLRNRGDGCSVHQPDDVRPQQKHEHPGQELLKV